MKALVVVGHPCPDSFNHALAGRVAQVWGGLGADVALHDLTAMRFDPCLMPEEARGGPSADPVVRAQIADLCAADLLCVVHPNMWGAPPAVMKGWIDRVFALHAAYTFAKGADEGEQPIGLLRLRGALILNTGNTGAAREATVFGDPLERMWRDCILGYCGVADVQRRMFGVVATSTPQDRAGWLHEAGDLAAALHSAPG